MFTYFQHSLPPHCWVVCKLTSLQVVNYLKLAKRCERWQKTRKILKDLKMTKDIFRPVKTHESQTKKNGKRQKTMKVEYSSANNFIRPACMFVLSWTPFVPYFTLTGCFFLLCFVWLSYFLVVFPHFDWFLPVFRQAKDTKRHLLPIFWVTEWTGDVKTVYFSEPVTGLPKPVFYRLQKSLLWAG